MKKLLFTIFKILVALVLIGKIFNWFLNFSSGINYVLNTLMFSLIGIAYVVMSFVWYNKLVKIIFLSCGFFLLMMNFFPRNLEVYILGFVCILTPMLIGRFYKEHDKPILQKR